MQTTTKRNGLKQKQNALEQSDANPIDFHLALVYCFVFRDEVRVRARVCVCVLMPARLRLLAGPILSIFC